VDGGWVAQASLEEVVLGANEMVGGLLGSGFWVLPGLCFDAKRVVSTTARCEGKIYGVRAANGSPAHNRSRLRLDGFGIFALRQYPRTWT
jgi:hypothetical protein